MSITVTNVLAGTNTFIADVKATADGDVTATIPHGMAAAPKVVLFTQLLSQGLTALSAWAATTIDGTNIVLTKLTSTGSGNANNQVRVTAMTPHSLIS